MAHQIIQTTLAVRALFTALMIDLMLEREVRVGQQGIWGGVRQDWLYGISKRGTDVLVSLGMAPICVVIGIILAILNPVFNPGPLMFCQKRVGQHGRVFEIYKFRTMTPGWVETAYQRFLRRHRIDEFPQFINVLQGNMSLIGPRPETPEYVAYYAIKLPRYLERLDVCPGLSGLAQLRVGYAANLSETRSKLRHDLRYLRDRSFLFDAWIACLTVLAVVTGPPRDRSQGIKTKEEPAASQAKVEKGKLIRIERSVAEA
ncbi:MAG: sugar transferase [Pseudomonadota bacterium]